MAHNDRGTALRRRPIAQTVVDNHTRAYYANGGRHILTGSSNESLLRLFCSSTGELVSNIEMYPGRRNPSLYVQSFRADPHKDMRLGVVVGSQAARGLEFVHVDGTQSGDTGA